MRLAILTLVVAAGCYSPDLADCVVSCASDSDCGGGQVCATGLCVRDGLTCSFAPGADAAVAVELDAGIDASPDAPPDAPTQTTLRLRVRGQGMITSEGLDTCTADHECVYTVEVGTPISLTASPYLLWQFDKWQQACGGQPVSCTITPPPDPEVVVTARFQSVFGGGNDDDD
jgi:hypothetical protein